MGVVITVDVVVGVLVHGARSRRRRTSQEENGREGPRSGYGAPGGRKRAHGPGWIRIPRWASPAKLHCNLVKFVFSKKATKIDEIFTVDLTLAT